MQSNSSTSSVFDPNTFMSTGFRGNLDTTYVLPSEGDYMAQIADVKLRSGSISAGKERAGEPWVTVDFTWELMGSSAEDQKTALNMTRLTARQSIMIDLLVTGNRATGFDLGVNKNMRLKRVLEATGLNQSKEWNLSMFKNLTAFVTVKHNKPEGLDDAVADVSRVVSLAKAQANGAAL